MAIYLPQGKVKGERKGERKDLAYLALFIFSHTISAGSDWSFLLDIAEVSW